ncbi:MAG: hypothetical protein NVSMB64_30470 [Candidatus Velthaea sp.]
MLIATELDDENRGPSITNTIESLAKAAVEAFGLDPKRLTVYQHYDYRAAAYRPNNEAETYDEVTFDWDDETACRPQWHRRSRASLRCCSHRRLRYDHCDVAGLAAARFETYVGSRKATARRGLQSVWKALV